MTSGALKALDGLDEEATARDVAKRLGGTKNLSPALMALAGALTVQAGGMSAMTAAVDGFAAQDEQIEKISAHHGDNWEVLLYGYLLKDRAVMFELTDKLRT